jgi:metallophosphoesterase (TIGR00282 family)
MMKILVLGDIVGAPGRRAVARFLREGSWDLVVANGENASGGIGITPADARQMLDAGVRVLTSGNHIWAHKEVLPYLDSCQGSLLRPANMPPGNPGAGHSTVQVAGVPVTVVNLQGRVFMPESDCPFRTVDRILSGSQAGVVIVDFHAEATSEKEAMGRYLDGRATIVAGTHTHVQTSDLRTLPGGTVYITDLGMCGSSCGVIGVRFDEVRQRFLTGRQTRLAVAEGEEYVSGLEVVIDDALKPISSRTIHERK